MEGAAATTTEYREVLLFLAAAGVLVPLFSRLRLSPVLGFLAAGVLLGPFGLGGLARDVPFARLVTISDPEEIRVLAELGVVLLLFMIGLELSLERLKRLRRYIIGLGGAQIVLTALAIGGVAYLMGLGLAASTALGLALSLSSTAVVLPVLAEREAQQTASGRISFSVLLAQDLALVPILFGISALAGRGEADFTSQLLGTFVPVAIVFAVLLVAGRLLLRPLLKAAARAQTRELFVAACLLVVIVTGLIAQTAGLSMGLGAFIAGLLLAETEYQREVAVTIEPFKGLFLGAFFLAVGIGLDLGMVAREPFLIVLLVLALIVGKALIIFPLARLFGATPAVAVQSALVLGAGGEFAFVILDSALGANLIAPEAERLAVATATLTMFAIPFLAWAGERIAGAADVRSLEPQATEVEAEAVIIVGFGRVGRLVADMLTRHEQPYLAIDCDAGLVSAQRKEGHSVVFGDASRGELLERCGLARAKAMVVTLDAPKSAEAVVVAARAARPDLAIIARARDDQHAMRLYELGVTDAVPETVEASLQLAENTLVDIGIPMGWVIASVHERREEFRQMFRDKIEGDREPRALRSGQA